MARWMVSRYSRVRVLRFGSCLQQRFGVERHRRNGVVDVVRDAAGHLAQGAQALLLHDGLLGLAQIVVGLLQGAVELRLMGGQRDVLAQLAQKLAFAAAEAVRLAGGRRSGRRRPGSPLAAAPPQRAQPPRASRWGKGKSTWLRSGS